MEIFKMLDILQEIEIHWNSLKNVGEFCGKVKESPSSH